MAEKTKVVKEQNKLKNSSRPTYDVTIRSITGNTNPRNPLSNSLQSQGWDCMAGEKQIWALAVSDKADERAKYVQLIQDFDPELASLAATILSQGLMEPVEVCEGGGGKFRLVFGARRCLAILFNWCLLGKPKEPIVQAFLQKGNATTLLHRAVVENIRKPQSVIEVARAIQTAINNGEDKSEIGRQLGSIVSDFNELRMCRVNGQKPTARDRWTAFYRLYRLSQGHGPFHDVNAIDCFRILFSDWSWIRACEVDGASTVTRVHVPKFLRYKLLEHDKKKRLYGDHWEWMDRDKIVAGQMHAQGIEVTPTEVAEVRRKVINLARQRAVEMNIQLPADDDDLLKLISSWKQK